MRSEIWRVITERIGKIEAFKFERDMQVFLMNNPAIVGCWDPEAKGTLPSLIREEIFSRGTEGGRGRMDMVGISKNEDGEFELRYILDRKDVYGPDFPSETFRVLKEKEEREYGEYQTRRLILEAWDRQQDNI